MEDDNAGTVSVNAVDDDDVMPVDDVAPIVIDCDVASNDDGDGLVMMVGDWSGLLEFVAITLANTLLLGILEVVFFIHSILLPSLTIEGLLTTL